MPHESVIKKISSALVALSKQTKRPKQIAIAEFFSDKKLATEHGRYLLEKGILQRVYGGKRGPSDYQWNSEVKPTKDLARQMALHYTELRKQQVLRRMKNGKKQEMAERISKLEEKVASLEKLLQLN